MPTTESRTKSGKMHSWLNTTVAIISLLVSGLLLYHTQCISDIRVVAGRQARLWVIQNPSASPNPQPLIVMSFVFSNNGGKTGALFDVKLNVKLSDTGGIKWVREFRAEREFDHIPLGDVDSTQELFRPVAVVGKSAQDRVYGFTPEEALTQEEIPKKFNLEIEVMTEWHRRWQSRGKYRVDNVTGVWQDIEGDSTVHGIVIDIYQIG